MDLVQIDTTFAVATASRRTALHWENETVSWENIREWVENPADRKESGNYLFGKLRESTVFHRGRETPCTGIHRGKQYVESRSAVLLDVDTPSDGFFDRFTLLWSSAGVIHTTHSSTAASPRYRLILPLDTEVSAEEYVAIAETVLEELGRENFDPTTTQPERYMYRPSASIREDYRFEILDGPPLRSEEYLSTFTRDLSETLPPVVSRRKRDPLELPGTAGAFNRVYADDWAALIREYELPYTPAGSGRWTYTGGTSVAGAVEISESLFYSHHSTDPARGHAQSAFDLVRIHTYGDLDLESKDSTPVNRLPSVAPMGELANRSERVVKEVFRTDFEDTETEEPDWRTSLDLSPKTGAPLDTVSNWELILENDAAFTTLYYNLLTQTLETSGDLPWREKGADPTISRGDLHSARIRVERLYGLKVAEQRLEAILHEGPGNIRRNPVYEYLKSLEGKWDGIPRVEESLPGVRPTPYTRMVARKVLVAAVARMYEPGCKWDHMLVLYGDEGLGKTFWIERLARGYAAPLGDLKFKQTDTLITMHRSWIVTSDEGRAFQENKDELKEFLTRTKDVFRAPYDRSSVDHPRRSVIWGTTNDPVFLSKQEGNRRYLIVHCEDQVDFEALTDDYIDQLWAEAVHLYLAGERLFLTSDESGLATEVRDEFTHEDTKVGEVQAYLERLVPKDWERMGSQNRRMFLLNSSEDFGTEGADLKPIDLVCTKMIWQDISDINFRQPGSKELADIREILLRTPGWESVGKNMWFGPELGTQRAFRRVESIL